ncbi:Maf family nucleotide pyrophosphatase [Paracrocinitomix mangrovi]|uniref:Maf family nucleotide pyrophosphatase n=1 Tax=Paracrocinitomix mangrovi TaxID=2862509 RepID=UPI001C8EB1EF|nr:Maf family nucleotide pyrophosphatase [Paracrocinitomix mangrovi]UKN01452.1 Maf family nucleotide pyrophosphatase [Paracrocinitomix mangrovi]
MLNNLANKNIILASKSPRRQQLLQGLDIDFEIRTKDVEEIYPDDLENEKVPEYLSKLKAEAFKDELNDNDILITSDTVVILGDTILEKPMDRDHSLQMLRKLSGQTHTVVTGVCIQSLNKEVVFSNHTKVTFAHFSDVEIAYYVDKYQPFDKAGSYGCQEWLGYIGIDHLEGSFYSVMGIPLHQVYQALKDF